MRAYMMDRPGVVGLSTVADPVCGQNEILVATEAVSVCSTDISYFRGHLLPHAWPIIPGHEYVGKIVEVGTSLVDQVTGIFTIGRPNPVGARHNSPAPDRDARSQAVKE